MTPGITQLYHRINLFLHNFHKDRLLSNSIYLMVTTFVMSVAGFAFWLVNTRFLNPEQIGLATTYISVATLITNFSLFGLNIAIVRFLPKSETKNELIDTAFSLLVIISTVLTLFFLFGIHRFSPPMELLLINPLSKIFFILFVPIATLNLITDSVFISYGKAIYTLIINTIMSLSKLVLTILLAGLGVYGIIWSYSLSTVVALILSFLFLSLKLQYNFSFRIDSRHFFKMWKFSFGNYLSSLLGSATSLLMPLLITSRLSPEITAYYYMPTMIVNLLMAIPRSSVSSLIAEGAREEEPLSRLAIKSFVHAYSILVPVSLIIFLFGNLILSAFGKSYSSEGFEYLRMIVFAILLAVPGFIGGAILNIKKKIKISFGINAFGSILSLSLNILFLSKGLFGLGLAAIINQVLINFVYLGAVISISKTPIENAMSLLNFFKINK